jgi:hypothetical protein
MNKSDQPAGFPTTRWSLVAISIGRVPRVLLRDAAPGEEPERSSGHPALLVTTARPATGSTARSLAAAWGPS